MSENNIEAKAEKKVAELKKEVKNEIEAAVWKFIGLLSFIVLAPILSGVVLKILWAWFVVAKFGLAVLTIPEAIGLGLIVSFLTQGVPTRKTEDSYRTQYILISGLLKPVLTLFVGWIVHLFL